MSTSNFLRCKGRLIIAAAAALVLAPAATAGIHIEISGVDAELKNNVMALLSIARYADRDRLEADSVERLYRRVDDEVRSALKPYGYYQPKVVSSAPVLDRERNWQLKIAIETGAPVLVDEVSVVVSGSGAEDPLFTAITSSLPIKPGDRLQHPLYEQIKSRLQNVATTYGYLDARMVRNELRVDITTLRASISLEIQTGERYRFGATHIQQNTIKEEQMRRFLRYQEGAPYDANQWLRTYFALDDSRYFSTVTVTPGVADNVNHIVPIEIVAESARRTYSFGAGYGTDTGVRGSVSWFNPRVNSLGHRLQVRLQASEKQQTFDARYDVPFGDPALERMSLTFVAADTRVSDSVRTGELSLTPSVTQVLGRWQRVVAMAVTHTTTRDTINGRQVDDLIVPGITYASVPKDYLGESLLTRDLTVELLGSATDLGAKAGFLRLHVTANRQLQLRPKWRLLLRGEVGTTRVNATSNLPGQYRFFAGGDVSVRGFANGELSPFVVLPSGQVERVGGRHLVTGSVEIVRDLPKSTGVAAFFDFGNAVDRFRDPLAYSAGLGVRWRLPGITFGLDVGQALRAPGYGKLPGPRVHLNITQRL